MENNYIIELKNVSKIFDDDTIAVDDFNLYVRKGEFITFLGPSGCGKSTTLRMIAGFEFPSKGEILLNGRDISNLPPNKRPINMVFQRYALFPHLDVYDNIAFGLRLKRIPTPKKDKDGNPVLKIDYKKIRELKREYSLVKKNKHLEADVKESKLKDIEEKIQKIKSTPTQSYSYVKLSNKEIDAKVARALKIVDLEALEDRDISTLSGGQQQRVAIARAIVNEPEILLLDEPLGALDLKMRKDMQLELKEMHQKLGITFIYVTHDQEEALTMSDTIVVMKDGVIQQIGTPKMIYDEPKNAFVADFIGESNIYNGTMIGDKKVRFLDYNFTCLDEYPLNEKIDVVVRPEDIHFVKESEAMIKGSIVNKIFKGVNYQYTIMIGKNELMVKSTASYEVGATAYLAIEPDGIHIMKKDFTTNVYTDAWINKNNEVMIDETPFACDVTQLVSGSTLDEEGNVVSKDGKHKYNFNDADVVAEIALDKIDVIDDIESEDCEVVGEIVDSIYVGDHYRYIVRTENEEDFVFVSPYSYNLNDKVGLAVKKEDIKLRLKKEVSEYEIFIIPIFFIVYYAFTDGTGNFSFDSLIEFFTTTNKINVLVQSLLFSTLNTIICLAIGYPIAYILSNKKFNSNYIIVLLFVMPMWINFVLRTGATRDVLTWLGINGGTNPYTATMIGLVYNYLPFVILPLYTTMLKLDKSQIEAAIDLGCNRVQVFTKSIIPQSIPGVVAAAQMVFMPTMSSYVIPETLSEGKIVLFGNSIYLGFANNQWNSSSFMAVIMLLIIGITMLITRNFTEKDDAKEEAEW